MVFLGINILSNLTDEKVFKHREIIKLLLIQVTLLATIFIDINFYIYQKILGSVYVFASVYIIICDKSDNIAYIQST